MVVVVKLLPPLRLILFHPLLVAVEVKLAHSDDLDSVDITTSVMMIIIMMTVFIRPQKTLEALHHRQLYPSYTIVIMVLITVAEYLHPLFRRDLVQEGATDRLYS